MADETTSQAQQRPHGVACTPCRRAKMKCVSSDSTSTVCDRCQRLRKQCTYELHRRGLWRRDQTGKREERIPPTNTHTDEGISSEGAGETHPLFHGSVTQLSDLMPTFQWPPLQSSAPGSVSASSRSDQSNFTPGSLVANPQDTRGFPLDAPFNLGRSVGEEPVRFQYTGQAGQGIARTPKQDDPINMGLVSQPCAQYLYEGFFKHFNCLVGLLDPKLYTFSYTRRRSSLLFTMVLTISSRVFQPESHQAIRDHSEVLLGRALLACDSAIEIVWAIICMYHWKDANDSRGYTLIGFALRLAASADWNTTRRNVPHNGENPEGSTELFVRQNRDKDRAWLALNNLDRTSTYFTNRPISTTVVPEQVVSRPWMTLTDWTYLLGDRKAVAGHELTDISRVVYDMMKTQDDSSSFSSPSNSEFGTIRQVIDVFNNRISEWGNHWLSAFPTFPNSEPFQIPLVYLYRDHTRLYFNSIFLHRMVASDNKAILASDIAHTIRLCYSSALGVLQQTVVLGGLDTIYYLWDTAHLMIAYSSMMISRLFKQANDESVIPKDEVLDILTQVTTIYVVAAKSMGVPEPRVFDARSGRLVTTNPVSVQARILSSILSRLKEDQVHTEDDLSAHQLAHDMLDIPLDSSLTWVEDQLNPSTSSLGGTIEPQQAERTGLDPMTFDQPHDISSSTSQVHEDLGFMLNDDIINSRYFDADLLSWNEPDMFNQPHENHEGG